MGASVQTMQMWDDFENTLRKSLGWYATWIHMETSEEQGGMTCDDYFALPQAFISVPLFAVGRELTWRCLL